MKKICLFFISLFWICLTFSQTYYPGSRIFTGTLEITPAANFKLGTFFIVKDNDSIWVERPLGTYLYRVSSGITGLKDNILDFNGNAYAPYAVQQPFLSFDISTDSPTLLDRLNLNGSFYATSGTFKNVSTNTFGTSTSAISAVSGAGYAGQFQSGTNITLYVNKSGTLSNNDNTDIVKIFKDHSGTKNSTGNIISIVDNPTTTGTISGKVLTATTGITERISLNPRLANGSSDYAYLLGSYLNLTGNTKLFSLQDSTTELIYVKKDTTVVNNILLANNGIIEPSETVSRTIYVSTTGSDVTGTGLIGAPFATILKALQNILPNVQNCTITVSLGGVGNFPMGASGGYDEQYELAKKSFVNSTLAFIGTDFTTIESGFTLSKTASRCFAYTLTKSGLTSTLNQYRGYYMSTGAALYPIAYNAAGTSTFEVEYLQNNLTTPTSIIDCGATITNPSNLNRIMDIGFGKNINSIITFDKLKIDCGLTSTLTFDINTTPKIFTNVKFDLYRIVIGNSHYNYYSPTINFRGCILNSSVSSTAFLTLYNITSRVKFTDTFINGQSLTTTQFILLFNSTINLQSTYCYGKLSSSPIVFGGRTYNINVQDFFECRDFNSFYQPNFSCKIISINANQSVTAPYFEFNNVTNLFYSIPLMSTQLQIGNIYGSLPTTLIKSLTSGYVFVDDKNDIHISVPGIYGEKEPGVNATLADNSSGTIAVGDITQNESVIISYKINRGTSEQVGTINMTKKSDTVISDVSFFDVAGVTFTKSLVGNVITLGWATTSTGTAATFKYQINRIML